MEIKYIFAFPYTDDQLAITVIFLLFVIDEMVESVTYICIFLHHSHPFSVWLKLTHLIKSI